MDSHFIHMTVSIKLPLEAGRFKGFGEEHIQLSMSSDSAQRAYILYANEYSILH